MANNGKLPPLSPQELGIIVDKGTEAPFSGIYTGEKRAGTYVCRACGQPLYESSAKFESGCGWPSFDDELPGAVRRSPDADGRRVEILCANCGGHLGHVFKGEGFTPKNTRHCVNSASMFFVPKGEPLPRSGPLSPGGASGDFADDPAGASEHAPAFGFSTGLESAGANAESALDRAESPEPAALKTAIFAGGCFWGIEHAFSQEPGVYDVVSGYTGGDIPNPSYEQVCTGRTGHAEAVRVTYDPSRVTYEQLARLFFELHDPTEINRQGPDIGTQYRSALFYGSEEERETALRLAHELERNGYRVMTQIVPAAPFYEAEEYHQDYIRKHPGRSCHLPVKRFEVPARR